MFEAFISIFGSGVVGALGWVFVRGVNLGIRVTVLESRHLDIVTLLNSRFDNVEDRLERIERSIDR